MMQSFNFDRTMLYTGLTRAVNRVVLIGNEGVLIGNEGVLAKATMEPPADASLC